MSSGFGAEKIKDGKAVVTTPVLLGGTTCMSQRQQITLTTSLLWMLVKERLSCKRKPCGCRHFLSQRSIGSQTRSCEMGIQDIFSAEL